MGLLRGDTRSLDYGSYTCVGFLEVVFIGA